MERKISVYTVNDIRHILNIGKNQAYELAKSGAFPTRRVGTKFLISRIAFENWLNCIDDK